MTQQTTVSGREPYSVDRKYTLHPQTLVFCSSKGNTTITYNLINHQHTPVDLDQLQYIQLHKLLINQQ